MTHRCLSLVLITKFYRCVMLISKLFVGIVVEQRFVRRAMFAETKDVHVDFSRTLEFFVIFKIWNGVTNVLNM